MSTKIEWTDETWNPMTGCTKVSQGCKNCYAERLAPKVFAGQMIGLPPNNVPVRPRTFTDVLTHPERLDAPLHWKKPRRIFVNSMSDLFHEEVPDDFIDRVFAVMAIANWHTFQVLTKRAERMLDYMHELYAGRMYEIAQKSLPAGWESFTANAMQAFANELLNVWLGVSAEDQDTFNTRIELLGQTQAAIRFVSCEPLLGYIDCGNAFDDPPEDSLYGKINWVIAGGESGPKARPSHPDWFRSLRDQCTAAGVPFFFKQWGEWKPIGRMYDDTLTLDDEITLDWDKEGGITVELISESGARWGQESAQPPPDTWFLRKVGKKAAGRLLDGRTHDEYPA